MNTNKLYEIRGETTVQLRKGAEIEKSEAGPVAVTHIYMMPSAKEMPPSMEAVDMHFLIIGVDKAKAEARKAARGASGDPPSRARSTGTQQMTSPSSPDGSGLIERLTLAADEAQADHEDDVARIYDMDGPIAGSMAAGEPVEVVISLADVRQAASALSAYEGRLEGLEGRANNKVDLEKLVRHVFYASPTEGASLNLAEAIRRYLFDLPQKTPEEIQQEFLAALSYEERAEWHRQKNITALEQSGEGLGASRANSGGTAQEPKSDSQRILGKEE